MWVLIKLIGECLLIIVSLTCSSQIVQVVSMLEVLRILVSVSFQSNDVNGAQYPELLFCVNNNNSNNKQEYRIIEYLTVY